MEFGEKTKKMSESAIKIVAKKDFHLVCGAWDKKTNKSAVDIVIKKGDDISKLGVPKELLINLKTEQVI